MNKQEMAISIRTRFSFAMTALCIAIGISFPSLATGVYASPIQEEESQEQAEKQEQEIPEEVPFGTAEDLKEVIIPVIDRDPFDRVYLDELNEDATLDVHPIQLEGEDTDTPIDPESQDGRLIFTMEDYRGRIFAVPWINVIKVARYSDLIMDEAEKAMEENDFGTAFRTLLYLSKLPGQKGSRVKLSQMMDRCIYEDAENHLEAGKFGVALSAFEELYRRSPGYNVRGSGAVIDKITYCLDQFIEDRVAAGEYEAARQILASLKIEYGAKVEDVVNSWTTEMRQRAITKIKEVKTLVDNDRGMAAHRGAREIMYIMPDMVQSQNAYNAVIEKYPFIFVGVTPYNETRDIRRIDDWSARRRGYMLDRWLVEFQRFGEDGGVYQFPAGRIMPIDKFGLKYRITIAESVDHRAVPPIQSYELADRLFDLATIDAEEYYVPWARLIDTIAIEDEKSVIFTLRKAHVRSVALLTMPWFAPTDPRRNEFYGLYKPVETEEAPLESETVYELNDRYPAIETEQSPRVIERVYRNASDATEALIRGDLDIVDRVFPGDIRRLKENPDISVRPYLVPTVHILVPNPRNPHMISDHFRRAIHFGINRKLIVRQLISNGNEYDGFTTTSGPFPRAAGDATELSYAYNEKVEPREYDPKLALVLANQFAQLEENRLEKEGEVDPKVPVPGIVIAYPDVGTIAASCEAIKQHLEMVGIKPVELIALPPGEVTPSEDLEYDLLYCEIQMQEPLVDAYRIFGRDGIAKMVDPTIEQALRKLDSAYRWPLVTRALKQVHEQAANNLTVLPLWQIVDHYAYRKNVFHVGDRDLVHLYQNLNEWRIDGLLPPENKEEE